MKLYGWIGLALLLVSEYCLFQRIEPFYSWFYCFAWWSYILLADNFLLIRSGRSLLTTRRSELWPMLPLSVFIWLIFEGYNLVLQNWAYADVPSQSWLRWPGYAAAFATVLPGMFITADLVESFLPAQARCFASEAEERTSLPASRPSPVFPALGLAMSLFPLIWPHYFFAAVWLGPIFLFDPFVERLGLDSLGLQIARGERRRVWSLLAGGLACGLLWEFWNFWAAGHWIYNVPYFGNWKVFQMPVLGFLGFPPFALECWIFYHLFARLRRRWSAAPAQAAFWLSIGIFCILMFYAIDRHTVVRFALHPDWSTVSCLSAS